MTTSEECAVLDLDLLAALPCVRLGVDCAIGDPARDGVLIVGLRGRPELNGTAGVAVAPAHRATGRLGVRVCDLDPEALSKDGYQFKTLAVLPENLRSVAAARAEGLLPGMQYEGDMRLFEAMGKGQSQTGCYARAMLLVTVLLDKPPSAAAQEALQVLAGVFCVGPYFFFGGAAASTVLDQRDTELLAFMVSRLSCSGLWCLDAKLLPLMTSGARALGRFLTTAAKLMSLCLSLAADMPSGVSPPSHPPPPDSAHTWASLRDNITGRTALWANCTAQA